MEEKGFDLRYLPGRLWSGLPVAVVVISLLSLLLLPIVVSRRTTALRREIADVAEPARTALGQIEFAQARQVGALRAYVLARSPRFVRRYRAAYETERAAFGRLQPLMRELGAAEAPALLALDSASAEWHSLNAEIIADAADPTLLPAALERHERLYEGVLASADSLERRLQAITAQRRARIDRLDRLQRGVAFFLVLLALGSVTIVLWLGRELAAGRAAAERERREKTAMLESTSEGITCSMPRAGAPS